MFPGHIFKYHYFIANSLSPRIFHGVGLGCLTWQITPRCAPPLVPLTLGSSKTALAGCQPQRAGSQVSRFRSTSRSRQLSRLHRTRAVTLLGRGRRLATARRPSSTWAGSAPADSPRCPHWSIALRFSEERPPNSTCLPREPLSDTKCQVNAGRTKYQGKSILQSWEEEEYLTQSHRSVRVPWDQSATYKTESGTQDFYFCLDSRQKIALCASCGTTKLENKL